MGHNRLGVRGDTRAENSSCDPARERFESTLQVFAMVVDGGNLQLSFNWGCFLFVINLSAAMTSTSV